MQITISGHNVELTPALRAYAEGKIAAVTDKFKDVVHDAKVLLSIDAGKGKESVHTAQATMRIGITESGTSQRHLEHACTDLYAAVDILCDKVHREASRIKTKQHSRRRRSERPMAV